MRALVPIADGSEEIEAVSVIDTLRRAGITVEVASVTGSRAVTASRGVQLVADKLIDECFSGYDVIALPGGMPGAATLAESRKLAGLLRDQNAAGRLIAAICAAPAVVLKPAGLLDGRRATCHPGFIGQLDARLASEDAVVRDGPVITSRGPGTAILFALALVEALLGKTKADEVRGPMCIP